MIEGLNYLKNVGKNKRGFRKYQYKRALVEIKIHHMAGAPNLRNLKMIIMQNTIHNLPFTVEDIEISEKIFSPDASTLK